LPSSKPNTPQKSFLFRIVAFFSQKQLRYLYKNVKNPKLLTLIFVLISGSTALGTITLAAYLVNLPLMFPPLGPSAFILFRTPMSQSACPRSFLLSHTAAVIVGLLSLHFMNILFPNANLFDPTIMNWPRVYSVALAMGLISSIMVIGKISHPPAAATALIAVMGFLDGWQKIMGLLIAVLLLAFQGFFFNRIWGGLPYPVWRSDPEVARNYGLLAGIPTGGETFWQQLSEKMFQKRN